MKTEVVEEAVVDTTKRVAKGYLNGTTRGQAYGIIASTALAGAVSGVVGTLYFVRKHFILEKRYVKVEKTDISGPPA